MGKYVITVRGEGSHNSKDPKDANRLAADFVGKLTAAGHQVDVGVFHYNDGAEDILTDPAAYLSALDEAESAGISVAQLARRKEIAAAAIKAAEKAGG